MGGGSTAQCSFILFYSRKPCMILRSAPCEGPSKNLSVKRGGVRSAPPFLKCVWIVLKPFINRRRRTRPLQTNAPQRHYNKIFPGGTTEERPEAQLIAHQSSIATVRLRRCARPRGQRPSAIERVAHEVVRARNTMPMLIGLSVSFLSPSLCLCVFLFPILRRCHPIRSRLARSRLARSDPSSRADGRPDRSCHWGVQCYDGE